MYVYGKFLLRLAIFLALVLGVIVLYHPAPVAAYQDCCQNCQGRYDTCLSGCTTLTCRIGCERQFVLCIDGCPACLSN